MRSPDLPETERAGWRRAGFLFAIVALMAFGWLGLLPQAAREQTLRRSIERVESQGIDPGAFFYTDHPRSLTD